MKRPRRFWVLAILWMGCSEPLPGLTSEASPGERQDAIASDTVTPTTNDTAAQDTTTPAGDVDSGSELPILQCVPGETDGCATTTAYRICRADGLGYEMVECASGQSCFDASCTVLNCPPDERRCTGLHALEECRDQGLSWEWILIDDCDEGVCKSGECTGGCEHDPKLQDGQDCVTFTADFTGYEPEPCPAATHLVVPSSGADQLAVLDLTASPPALLPTSPFDTCLDPSRILLTPDGDIIASCRGDGRVQRHGVNGTVKWSTKMPACDAARGAAMTSWGRLFAACSSSGVVHELSLSTGAVLGNVPIGGHLYGLAIDQHALYVASRGLDKLGTYDKVVRVELGGDDDLTIGWTANVTVYGFAADGLGHLWLGGEENLRALDTTTGAVTTTVPIDATTYGVAVGPDGVVYAGLAVFNQVARMTPAGAVDYLTVPAGDSHPRGVTVDSDGHLWTINLTSNNLTRFDAFDGSTLSIAQGSLVSPYGYSGDMSGTTIACLATGDTTWTSPLVDAGSMAKWLDLQVDATLPGESTMTLFLRSDDSGWLEVGENMPAITGQMAQVRAELVVDPAAEPPVIHWVGLTWETE